MTAHKGLLGRGEALAPRLEGRPADRVNVAASSARSTEQSAAGYRAECGRLRRQKLTLQLALQEAETDLKQARSDAAVCFQTIDLAAESNPQVWIVLKSRAGFTEAEFLVWSERMRSSFGIDSCEPVRD